MPVAKVHRISAASPDDVSGIEDPRSRPAASIPRACSPCSARPRSNGLGQRLRARLRGIRAEARCSRRHLGRELRRENSACVMSGGTEGGHVAPLDGVRAGRPKARGPRSPALALRPRPHRRRCRPEHLGRLPQADMVAEALRAAMRDAKIDDSAAVHFVQVKCPLLTGARCRSRSARRGRRHTKDTLKSMNLSRAASALGAARSRSARSISSKLSDAQIGSDWTIWSGRGELLGRRRAAGARGRRHGHVLPAWSGPLAHRPCCDG